MPNMQFDGGQTELCHESHLNICRLLQGAPLKSLLLKDGCRITEATVWSEISKEYVVPPMNEDNRCTFSLIQAYLKNDEAALKSLLSSEECSISDDVDGETPLARAVARNSVAVVELLLQRGADPNTKEKKIDSAPIIEAAKEGFDCVLKLLLQYGASVSLTANNKYTALHFAAANGHLQCVKLLLQYGSPLEVQNENGHTPLMEATSNGHIDVAKCLIEHGANINTHSTEFKESALTLASYKGHVDMVRFLLDAGASHEHRTDEMHTALMEAAMEGHVEVARLLLAHGANVNIPQDSFESPLTLAACGGHTELALILIGYEADIEEVNDEGYTPLMEAAREGHDDTVAVLLAAGAYVNAKTEETQETALTLAACGGFIDVCEMLLKAGADLEVGDVCCSTPLMEAAQEGHLELVSRLLQRGAKVDAMTTSGDTALHYAAENGHASVCKELLNWGASMNQPGMVIEGYKTPLMKAARAGHLEVVQFLVEWGFPVNQPTLQNDATALSLACNGGHFQVVEYLLRNGANPNYELRDGCTMLIESARSGSTAVLQLILDYPKSLSLLLHGEGADHQTPQLLPPTAPPPNLTPPAQQVLPLPNDDTDVTLLAPPPPPQLAKGAAPTLMPQQQRPATVDATAATLLVHHQPHRTGVVVPRALNAHPSHHPQLKEALANAYAAGWADGAASRAQQSSATAVDGRLPPLVGDESQVCTPEKVRETSRSKCHKPATFPEKSLKPKACHQLNPSSLGIINEKTVADLGDPSRSASADELSSRLMSLFRDLKDEGTDFLNQLSTAMTSTMKSSPTSCARSTSPTNRDAATAVAATNAARDLQRFKKCASGGSGDVANPTDDFQGEYCQGRVHICEHFSSPPPPPTKISPITSSTTTTSSSSEREVRSTRSSVHSTSTSDNSIRSTSTHPIDVPSVVAPVGLCHQHAIHEKVLPCTLKVANSCTQAIAPPSPGDIDHQHETPMGSTVPPQKLLPAALATDLYDHLCCAPAVEPQQVDINACTESSMESALTLACSGGFVDLARLLLERGADKEHRDKKSQTPLHTAVYANQRQIVALLLQYGADIEAQVERTKDTALSIACSHGRLETSEELLNRGANKEHRNFSDYTPLSLAASGGFVDVIELLLRHGAEINSRTGSKLGISPLMLASMNGYTDAVRVLLEHGADINAQIETNKNTALTLACFQGQHEVVKLLVERKANIEHRAKTGLTPLMEAASGNHVKVGCILLEHGADVNALPVLSSRDTALTIAADKGKTEFVNLLLKHGVLVEARNKKGATSLWLACNGGHLEVVERLIAANADVNSQDNRRVSCLMAAFRRGHVKMVSLLVRYVTQFPSDKDCLRHIKVVASEKELAERCQQCRKLISTAKEKQEGEARKNANVLLEQIEREEAARAHKEATQARKRERKRNKRRARQETTAALAATDDDDDNNEGTASSNAPPSSSQAPSKAVSGEQEQSALNAAAFEPTNRLNYQPEGTKQKLPKSEIHSPNSDKDTEMSKGVHSQQAVEVKSRVKKQTQKTSKCVDSLGRTASSQASSEAVGVPSAPSITSCCEPLMTSPDVETAFWDFEHSLDPNSSGNANDWLVAQPPSSNRCHRYAGSTAAANLSEYPSKIIGSSGCGGLSKRKVAFSVCKHDIGKIIGQGGAVVSALRTMSGIQIDIESARGDEVTERMVYLKGPTDIVQRTYHIIQDLLSGTLAGNDVIARAKSSSKPSSLSTAFSTINSSSTIPMTRAGSTHSKKMPPTMNAGHSKISTLHGLSTLQPLMSKLTSPVCLKTNESNNSNAAATKVASTSISWVGVKSATGKGNFASVAASGVVPSKEVNHSKPSDAHPFTYSLTESPMPLTSVSAHPIAANDTSNAATATPVPLILDEQSFPPLSTTASSTPTVVSSGASVTTSKVSDPPIHKTSLSSTQTKMCIDRSPTTTAPLPVHLVNETPRTVAATDSVSEPLSFTVKTTATSHVSVAPIGVSRPFARAPGSERSAQRNTVSSTAFATADVANLPDLTCGVAVTPTKQVSDSFALSKESMFAPRLEVAASNPTTSHMTDPLESLLPTAQHQAIPGQFNGISHPMWFDFGAGNVSTNVLDNGASFEHRNSTASVPNYLQLLSNKIGTPSAKTSSLTLDDEQQLPPFFPSISQSNSRTSQQCGVGVASSTSRRNGTTLSSGTFASAFSTAAAASFGCDDANPLLFSGLSNGSNGAAHASLSSSATARNPPGLLLPPRLNPAPHHQQVASQSPFMNPQHLLHSGLLPAPHQAGDQKSFLRTPGLTTYPPSSGSLPYEFSSLSLQAAASSSIGGGGGGSCRTPQPLSSQPVPIGAERRRCLQGPVAAISTASLSSALRPAAPPMPPSLATNPLMFGSPGQNAAAAANEAFMALLAQQHQHRQHRPQPHQPIATKPCDTTNGFWSQPPSSHHPLSGHPGFWSQNMGGGFGNSSEQPCQRQPQPLVSGSAAEVAAWSDLWPWPSQAVMVEGGGGGRGRETTGWMMPPTHADFPTQIPSQQQQPSSSFCASTTRPPLNPSGDVQGQTASNNPLQTSQLQ